MQIEIQNFFGQVDINHAGYFFDVDYSSASYVSSSDFADYINQDLDDDERELIDDAIKSIKSGEYIRIDANFGE